MPMPEKKAPEKYCQHCGKKMKRKRYNGRLEDMAVFLRRKYCNLQCAGAVKRKDTLHGIRKRYAYLRGNKCQECGVTENLDLHHRDGNPVNNDISNLMTLCDSCHTKWHWKNGKKPYKRQSVCIVCGNPARKLDMCQKHYQRFKKYGSPYLTKRKHGSRFVLVDERVGLPAQAPSTPGNRPA